MLFNFDIKGPLANISSTFFFFDLPFKLSVVYIRNKQTNSVTNMEFYKHVQYCFCWYVIKSAGEAANEILLSVVWNPLLIEINLSQFIRALDIKREKVCAVCQYLLLIFCLSRNVAPKPTDQSCSNSTSGVPLQIFPVSLFFSIYPQN